MVAKPRSVDEYMESLSSEQREVLEKLRRTISAAAPEAEECISYNIPTFRFDGKMLVAFGAARNHCSFFAGALPVNTHKDDLARYDTSKGTIRFQVDKPLSAALVRKLVKARMAERVSQRKKGGQG